LPDDVSLELGALVEPLTVGVHGAKLGSVKFGDSVVVFGACPVNLLAPAVATMFESIKVMVVDVFDSKRCTEADIAILTGSIRVMKRDALGASAYGRLQQIVSHRISLQSQSSESIILIMYLIYTSKPILSSFNYFIFL
jgi:threonine dehydrogenase-like Zn-dependent dehydrogenase